MELEIHEITNSEEKTRQNNHLQSFKAELKRLQHEYNLTQRRVQRQNDRKLLLSDGDLDSNFIEVDVRNSAKDKLLENTENLERSSRKLDHGQELLHESESVGAGVLADLAHQKEVISRARNRVRILREIISDGSNTILINIERTRTSFFEH